VCDLVRALDRVRPLGSVAAPLAAAPSDDAAGTATPDDAGAAATSAEATVSRAEPARRTQNNMFAGAGLAVLSRRLGFDVASAPSYAGGTVYWRSNGRAQAANLGPCAIC